MTCASCASTVQRAALRTDGVLEARVNVMSGRVLVKTVTGDAAGQEERARSIVDDIEVAGFDAHVVKTTSGPRGKAQSAEVVLQVEGMTCASCASTVQRAALRTDGVLEARVNVMSGRVLVKTVTGDAAGQEERARSIVDDIEVAGFDAHVVKTTSGEERSGPGVDPDDVESGGGGGQRRPLETLVLSVTGMTCEACPTRIMDVVGKEPAVASVNVSIARNRVAVEYQPSPEFGPRDIFAIVEDMSYTPSLWVDSEGGSDDGGDLELRHVLFLRGRFLIAAALTVPLMFIMHERMGGSALARFLRLTDEERDNVIGWFGLRSVFAGDLPFAALLSAVLAGVVQWETGRLFYTRAYRALRVGTANMDVLVASGAGAAYLYSAYFMLRQMAEPDAVGEDFFHTSAMILTFVALGNWLQEASKRRSSSAIRKLLAMQATTATVLTLDGYDSSVDVDDASRARVLDEEDIDAKLLHIGDVVKVLPFEKVPADGVVVLGSSAMDESLLTGESRPVPKQMGAEVVGGSLNGSGRLFVRVTRVGKESMLGTIVSLVEDAQMTRAPSQVIADRVLGYVVPGILGLSAFVFVVWLTLAYAGALPPEWTEDDGKVLFSFLFALAVLLISCPCALGLATPTAVMVGTGVGARHGILIKGADVIENLAEVKHIVFDKTGTLTKGQPHVVRHLLYPEQVPAYVAEKFGKDDALLSQRDEDKEEKEEDDEDDGEVTAQTPPPNRTVSESIAMSQRAAFRILYAAEEASEHPIAAAITAFTREKAYPNGKPVRFRSKDATSLPGMGVVCKLAGGVDVAVGNRRLMQELGIEITKMQDQAIHSLARKGFSIVLLSVGVRGVARGVCAWLAIGDTLRPEAHTVVNLLRRMQIEPWVLSGDNAEAAASVGAQVGIPASNIIAEVKPADKEAKIRSLQAAHGTDAVAMVGDGVNDAPAIARASVGIAIGAGSDVAIEAANVVLVNSSLGGVATAVSLGRVVTRRIKINLWLSLGYNIVAIPVAAGVLYPFTAPARLPPSLAAFAMAMSSVCVVASSLLLNLFKPPRELANVTGIGNGMGAADVVRPAKADVVGPPPSERTPLLG